MSFKSDDSEFKNKEITKEKLARMIDHTLLKPEATYIEIENLCKEAIQYNFFSVCVNPIFVKFAKEIVEGSVVKIASVVGFPLGANETDVKAIEAERVSQFGADEIDMVMNIGWLKSKDYKKVEKDIKKVVDVVNPKIVKVIIEACLLENSEKITASKISVSAGAMFVKTSTGFSKGGATTEDVALIRSTVGKDIGVKASGGIRNYETAIKMILAGATRIGASKSVDIVR
jgi:deoxyribose-phosphate aldolase